MSGISFRVPLTQEEQQVFTQHFKRLDQEQLGIVTGEALKPLFSQSGLTAQQLSQIWAICDTGNTGFLNVDQFNAALRMISHLQMNPSLPITLELYQTPASRLPTFESVQQPFQQPPQTGSARSLSRSNTGTSPSFSVIPVCTPHNYAKFAQLFDRSTDGTGKLPGNKAREIFLKAKLPTQTLGSIWGLCDRSNSGSLDKVEFVMAMHLIQLIMQQNPAVQHLPATLPTYLWNSLNTTASSRMTPLSANSTGFSFNSGSGSVVRHSSVARKPSLSRLPSGTFSNAAIDWTLTPEKKQQFDTIFDSLDKERQGSLGSNVLVPFFLTSKLSQDVLATVWDLADIHNSPVFSKVEFAIAMFLIQKKNAGIELPDVVPEQLLNSPALGLFNQQSPVQTHGMPSIPSRDTKPSFQSLAAPQVQPQKTNNSALDDLLGLNESFTPPPSSAQLSQQNNQQQHSMAQSNVASNSGNVRKFRPSSTFGQNMIPEEAAVPPQQPQTQRVDNNATLSQAKSFSVPPVQPPAPRNSSLPSVPNFAAVPITSRAVSSNTFTDSAGSASLSQATTELANLSNQVSSLTTQATKVHQEKNAAQGELLRINNMKTSIESKLASLRASYDQEVRQTDEIQKQLNVIRQENESLTEQAAVAEANYHAVQTQVQDLQTQLQQAQQENQQLKEKLSQVNSHSAQLQQQLAETQENVRQELSKVDVHSKQLEVSEITADNLKNEIQGIEQTVAVYLSKHKELTDYKTTIEAQHSEMETKHQNLLAKSEEVKARETEMQSRTAEIEQQEKIYRDQVAQLEIMFVDLNKKKAELQAANSELERQQYEYADRIQKFSENQMKLAMGEIPDDDFTNEIIQKRSQAIATHAADDDEKPESVFDKDVPTPVSQTEPDEEQDQQHQIEQRQQNQVTQDEAAAEAMADSFQGSLNEYGIPRPESVTSSTANNPPQSVRDEVESEPKEPEMADMDQQLESEDIDNTKGIETATTPQSKNEPLPGGWSAGSTLEKQDKSESDDDSIKKTPELLAQDKKANVNTKTEDLPPIQKLRIDESDSSDNGGSPERFMSPEKNVSNKDGRSGYYNQFEQISHKDLDDNVFHDANSDLQLESQDSRNTPVGNDEWDQIFSGLGSNADGKTLATEATSSPIPLQHPIPTVSSLPLSSSSKPVIDRGIAVTPKSLAVEELTSMGFSTEEATKALEKCNWDLDDATNILLDGA